VEPPTELESVSPDYKSGASPYMLWGLVVSPIGFEPMTYRLEICRCYPAELRGPLNYLILFFLLLITTPINLTTANATNRDIIINFIYINMSIILVIVYEFALSVNSSSLHLFHNQMVF
jgi:hypothetical protein